MRAGNAPVGTGECVPVAGASGGAAPRVGSGRPRGAERATVPSAVRSPRGWRGRRPGQLLRCCGLRCGWRSGDREAEGKRPPGGMAVTCRGRRLRPVSRGSVGGGEGETGARSERALSRERVSMCEARGVKRTAS